MHLIAALAAGIDGCEGGTFDIVLRGTPTPASYYTDFEGNTAPIVGTGVALDSRGGGIFYVNTLVKVTCKSAGGATVREFIAGDAATAVEVRSDSFTGNAYVGGAAAVGNPTTVAAVLDLWNNSAGCEDFKVLIAGVKTNLSSAFSALQGQRRFVVTEYGAVGDGVTNCTSAINAAISAANAAGGGIVYFPPGTYLTSTITAFATVTLEGAGPSLTTLRNSSFGLLINGACPAVIRGISFTFAGAASNGRYINASSVTSGQAYLIEDCKFAKMGPTGGSGCIHFGAATPHSLVVSRCTIEIGASAIAVSCGSSCTMRVLACDMSHTDAAASTSNMFVRSDGANLHVAECTMDCSGVTSGSVAGIGNVSGAGITHAIGNRISPPGTSVTWQVFQMNSTRILVESGNSTQSTASAYSSTYSVYGTAGVLPAADSQLGSRVATRGSPANQNADPLLLPLFDAAVITVQVTSTAGHTANVDLQAALAPRGMTASLLIWNDTAGSITFQWGSGFSNTGATFAVAANSVRGFTLASMIGPGGATEWYQTADVAGAEVVE